MKKATYIKRKKKISKKPNSKILIWRLFQKLRMIGFFVVVSLFYVNYNLDLHPSKI